MNKENEEAGINPHDGFPLALSPLGWAKVCRLGDSYSYELRGMAPVLDDELELIIAICADRGLELYADDSGMGVPLAFDEE